MYLILLALGILLAAAGGALMGFGILFSELPTAMPLVVSGVLAVIGGFLLFGLSAVVAQLARIGTALTALQSVAGRERTADISAAQPQAAVAREPVQQSADIIEVFAEAPRDASRDVSRDVSAGVSRDVPRELPRDGARDVAPHPAAASPAADVSESAIERLRSMIARPEKVSSGPREVVPLSPNGQLAAHHVDPASRSAVGVAVEAQEPRLDFLFRPRPGRPVAQQQRAFESLWPTRPGHEDQPNAQPDLSPRGVSHADGHGAHGDTAPEPAPARSVTILKSGVVDGMAYTLYADGSIEAQLPQGTVRFGSIAELRTHIESNV